MLDHLLAELNDRFTEHQKKALQGLYLVPSVMARVHNGRGECLTAYSPSDNVRVDVTHTRISASFDNSRQHQE